MQTRRVASEACDCRPAAPIPPGQLAIGQVARRTGLRAKTIRYYEDIGLLPRPPRGANGYRRYRAADVSRILLLQSIRCLGVSLSVAKPLLMGAAEARCADVQEDLLRLVHQRLQALDHEIAEALGQGSIDDLKIKELKRRKLMLKDEIERLRHDHAL